MPQIDTGSVFDMLRRTLAEEPEGVGRATPSIAWASTRGSVRKENQDRILVARSPTGLVVAVVADGMGGMRDGSRAAAIAVATVAEHCMLSQTTDPYSMLRDALNRANEQVFRVLRGEGGAALVVLAWTPNGHHIAHVGDARAYQIEGDGDLSLLTTDDTVAAQLQCLRQGSSPEVNSDNRLVQFVGVGTGLQPHVAAVPPHGRGLLLATDGIYGVPSSVLNWIVKGTEDAQLVAERIVATSEWSGGHDNATAVVVNFRSGSGTQEKLLLGVEYWAPGERLLCARTIRPPVSDPVGASSVQQQPASSAGKKRRNTNRRRKGRATAPRHEEPQRELPIVTFEEGPAKDDSSLRETKPTVDKDPQERKEPKTK